MLRRVPKSSVHNSGIAGNDSTIAERFRHLTAERMCCEPDELGIPRYK